MQKFIDKEELLEALADKYGSLEDDGGCSVYHNGKYVWLSVADIVEVIENCMEYDEDYF